MIFHQPSNSLGNYNYNATTYQGEEYAPHFHTNLEVLFVLQGEASVTVNGVTVTPSAGEAVLVLPNQIHTFVAAENSVVWVAVFSEDFVPKFVNETKGQCGRTPLFALTPAVQGLLMENMIEHDCSLLMKKACLYALCDSYKNAVTWEVRADKSDSLVGDLLEWLTTHYAENVTLKGAAQQFGYEYHYFSHLLSREYGINFRRLLNQYRVEEAAHLLESTTLSITDIALKSGFQTIRSFNHVFREHMGKSPREYREET